MQGVLALHTLHSEQLCDLQCGDFDIYAGRIAALKSLHPKLDVGTVITKQPGTLKVGMASHNCLDAWLISC